MNAPETVDYRDAAALATLVSEDFSHWSAPLRVDQEMIDQYAVLSGDRMWMHVDAERCARESPFGRTIAHGFLILSLLPRMPCGENIVGRVSGYSHMMNYGSDKLRFLGAVTVDSDIHARSRVKAVNVAENKTRVVLETHVHVVGSEQPALVYELMFVFL
jgi:acyl dehydratase